MAAESLTAPAANPKFPLVSFRATRRLSGDLVICTLTQDIT